jgi:hypothetical protein
MARLRKSEAEQAKSKLLARARKLAKDIHTYGAFGWVDRNRADHVADDRRLERAIDALYDAARKEGLAEDQELQQVRMNLRAAYVLARVNASEARRSTHISKAAAGQLGSTEQGYLDELKLARAKGKL